MAECYTAKTIGEGRGGYGRVLHSQDNRRGEGGYVMAQSCTWHVVTVACVCVLNGHNRTQTVTMTSLDSPFQES